MRPHRKRIFPPLAAALVAVYPVAAAAQEQGYPFRLSNFKLEFSTGATAINPEHLNILADFEEAFLRFHYLQRYEALKPAGYEVSLERTGDSAFRPLNRATPWGFRLKYELSPTLALALGLQYLSASQGSSVAFLATGRNAGGAAFTDRYENPGFGLWLKAWLPQLTATFGWNIGPAFRYELFIAGGPMLVEVGAESDVRRTFTGSDGSLSETSELRSMRGKASSWEGEAGAILRLSPWRFLDLFCEGSYAFREAREFQGPGTSRLRSSSSAAGESVEEKAWDGTWQVVLVSSKTAWGTFDSSNVVNNVSWNVHPRPRKFEVQFSGFQVKFGLGVRL
jgi:hypothetical protein